MKSSNPLRGPFATVRGIDRRLERESRPARPKGTISASVRGCAGELSDETSADQEVGW
jgi:hypothetical protein